MARLVHLGTARLLAICLLPALNAAQNTGNSSQANDSGLVGWQPNPSGRGTLNILLSCLLTITACTWTIQHLNVPEVDNLEWYMKLWRSLKWMMLNVIVPEFILAVAFDEFLSVRRAIAKLDLEKEERVQRGWLSGLSDCFKLLRGKDTDCHGWKKKHCYYGDMGGFIVKPGSNVRYPIGTLDAAGYSTDGNTELKAPPVGVEEIKDKSKGNYFTKFIAMIQILWTIASALARAIKHRALAQLEIITVAFAICAVITYLLRLEKPQDIMVGTSFGNPPSSLRNSEKPRRFRGAVVPWLRRQSEPQDATHRSCFRNDTVRMRITLFSLLLMLAMAIVGGIHLLAWNFAFPTSIERLLWRYASAISTGVPVLILVVIPILEMPALYFYGFYLRRRSVARLKFKLSCHLVLKNLSKRNTPDGDKFAKARDRLGECIQKDESTHYRFIFTGFDKSDFQTMESEIGTKTTEYQVYSDSFPETFTKLHRILYPLLIRQQVLPPEESELNGHAVKLRDNDADLVDTFPFRTRHSLREIILRTAAEYFSFMMTIVYTLARLLIIAVALSSLRAMPRGVYQTTWTRYIPNMQ